MVQTVKHLNTKGWLLSTRTDNDTKYVCAKQIAVHALNVSKEATYFSSTPSETETSFRSEGSETEGVEC